MPRVGGIRAAIGASILLLAACGSDSNEAGTRVEGVDTERSAAEASSTTTTRPTTTTTTTTTTAPDPDAEVLQAYERMWNAVRRALNPPDPDLADLAATHTEPALEAVRSQVRDVLAKGAVMRGDVELNPTVVSRTDIEAVIEDCIVDHGHLIDPGDGSRLDADEADVVYNHARTTMVREDGVWKRKASEQISDTCTP